ncbi:hypothetical protein [Pelomicrobium sp. G1]
MPLVVMKERLPQTGRDSDAVRTFGRLSADLEAVKGLALSGP